LDYIDEHHRSFMEESTTRPVRFPDQKVLITLLLHLEN
jgi:hypothetical protein